MNVKAAFFVAILVAAAAFAPTASADTESFVLDVQGTDYSVLAFSGTTGKETMVLPLQPGTVALFEDVLGGKSLGTIELAIFDDGVLQDTFSFTKAVAISFQLHSDPGVQMTDSVEFTYKRLVEVSSNPTNPAPEPSSLALLAMGLVCALGVSLRR
jgi:hypothetical protein